MATLQEFDIIKIPYRYKNNCGTFSEKPGAKYIQITINKDYIRYAILNRKYQTLEHCHCFSKTLLETLKEKQLNNFTKKITKFMSKLKENVIMMLKGEPERSFIKHGVTDTAGTLTPEGQEVFLSYLLSKHGSDFKKDVLDNIETKKEKE